MKITDAINKAVVIEENMSLKQAAKVMADRDIGCLIVMKGEKITGIITEHDILKNADNLLKKVSNSMTRNIITIERTDTIEHAAELMKNRKIKKLPVVDHGKLVGVVTVTDIINHIAEIDEDFLFE